MTFESGVGINLRRDDSHHSETVAEIGKYDLASFASGKGRQSTFTSWQFSTECRLGSSPS